MVAPRTANTGLPSLESLSDCLLGYLAWEYPTNRLLQRLPLAKYSAFCILMWGLVLSCFAGVNSYSGAIAIRIFLGVFEAAVTPGFALLTSQVGKLSRISILQPSQLTFCRSGIPRKNRVVESTSGLVSTASDRSSVVSLRTVSLSEPGSTAQKSNRGKSYSSSPVS